MKATATERGKSGEEEKRGGGKERKVSDRYERRFEHPAQLSLSSVPHVCVRARVHHWRRENTCAHMNYSLHTYLDSDLSSCYDFYSTFLNVNTLTICIIMNVFILLHKRKRADYYYILCQDLLIIIIHRIYYSTFYCNLYQKTSNMHYKIPKTF